MAQMKRNLNLEELDSDAFLGIKYLAHQTVIQKVCFFGGIIIGIGSLIAGTLLELPSWITYPIMFVFIGIAVLFGANYNEDFTILEYAKMMLFKPVLTLTSQPTEDIDVFKLSAERLRKDEEQKLAQQKGGSPEEQKKMLRKVILLFGTGILMLVLIIALVMAKKNATSEDDIVQHHTIAYETVTEINTRYPY